MQVYNFSKDGLAEAFNDAKLKNRAKHHIKKHGKAYITITLLSSGFMIGLADPTMAAVTSLDTGANKLYLKLINVGKWVIIIKGGLETIQASASGDFQGAKTKFLSYLLTYAILWALPWTMNEVENIFKGGF